MNSSAQERYGLVDEVAHCGAAILVPRRDNLDHRDGSAQMVLQHDKVSARGIDLLRGAAHETSYRRRHGRDARVIPETRLRPTSAFHGQNIRFLRA
jgi:hypothetical protein